MMDPAGAIVVIIRLLPLGFLTSMGRTTTSASVRTCDFAGGWGSPAQDIGADVSHPMQIPYSVTDVLATERGLDYCGIHMPQILACSVSSYLASKSFSHGRHGRRIFDG